MLWVLLYRCGLWVLPGRCVKRWISEPVEDAKIGATKEPTVSHILRSVRRCSQYVPQATCLTQALAARKLLGRIGQPAVLQFGVVKCDGKLEAHAWLEIEGRIVLGKQREHSRYSVLVPPTKTV